MRDVAERAAGAGVQRFPSRGLVSASAKARTDLGESSEQAYRESAEFAAEVGRLGVDIILCPEDHGDESGYAPSLIRAKVR